MRFCVSFSFWLIDLSPTHRVHVSSVLCYDSLGHIRLILSISFLRLYHLSFLFPCPTNCQVSLLTWWLVCRRLSPGEMTIQLEWQKEHKWPKETSSDFVSLSMDGLNGDRRQIGRVFVSLEVFWPLIRLEISDDLFPAIFLSFSPFRCHIGLCIYLLSSRQAVQCSQV